MNINHTILKYTVSILLFFIVFNLKAQPTINFATLDKESYNAYLNGNWDKVINIGKQGIENNIDYFYLRLRIAYAYYMKEQYLKAIKHYKKALIYSDNNAIALEYLYYCYLYTGRINDAEKLVKKLPGNLKKQLNRTNKKKALAAHFLFTYANGVNANVLESIAENAPQDINGIQTATNQLINFNLGFSYRLNHSTMLHITSNLLYKDYYSWLVDGSTLYLSESQIVRQMNNQLLLDIMPAHGFIISPILTVINYRIPIFYDYGQGSNKNREVYEYDKENELAFGAKACFQSGITKTSLAAIFSNYNYSTQHTYALAFSIFPMANLKLYYTLSTYLHKQQQNGTSITNFIQKHEIGFKVQKHLWIEASLMHGEFNNFYDAFTGINYNSIEHFKNIVAINFHIPLYKNGLSLFFNSNYNQAVSVFTPENNSFDTQNNVTFNYQSFTGGLLWRL